MFEVMHARERDELRGSAHDLMHLRQRRGNKGTTRRGLSLIRQARLGGTLTLRNCSERLNRHRKEVVDGPKGK